MNTKARCLLVDGRYLPGLSNLFDDLLCRERKHMWCFRSFLSFFAYNVIV